MGNKNGRVFFLIPDPTLLGPRKKKEEKYIVIIASSQLIDRERERKTPFHVCTFHAILKVEEEEISCLPSFAKTLFLEH